MNRSIALSKQREKEWQERLESWKELEVACAPSWTEVLAASNGWKRVLSFLEDEEAKGKQIFPPKHQVLNALNFCSLDSVKVVILGQDPYHNDNQAHGMSFSVRRGVRPPPSLLNMFKELEEDPQACVPQLQRVITVEQIKFERPKHGCLEAWAAQGVLMLNATLTVEAHKANSHQGQGWEELTDAIVRHLNQTKKGLVFILWGRFAQEKGKVVDKKRHHVLSGTHPSPLSASKGFFGCRHFSKANKFLLDQGQPAIDWQLPQN